MKTHLMKRRLTTGEQMFLHRMKAIGANKPDDQVIQDALADMAAVRDGSADKLTTDIYNMLELN